MQRVYSNWKIDPMLPCDFSIIDHRRRQNLHGKNKQVTHEAIVE